MQSEFFDMITRHRGLDKVAFQEDGFAITHPELHRKAVALGSRLAALHGGANAPILIVQPKSINAIVSIFACVEAGLAFIPVDPKFPADRIAYILLASGARSVLAGGFSEEETVFFRGQGTVILSYDWKDPEDGLEVDGDASKLDGVPPVSASRISHIIFTSGTTGNPKGVMIKEESQVAFVREMAAAFRHDTSTRWLSVAPFYFDVFTLDLFVESYCGSTVFLVSPNIMPHQLAQALEQKGITHLVLISSHVKMLVSRFSGIEKRDLSKLKKLWYGGEACPVESLRALKRMFPHLEFAQCYGPSEVCNNATLHEFAEIPDSAQGYMPLGRTLSTVKGYVVDASGKLLQGLGTGELYLGGVQVMDGYVNDPELTRNLLIENPFEAGDPHKVYKTGDFVRVDENGLLSFHGRKDDLVKVRGNRISLHEVQSVMVSIEGVLDAAVFVKKDPQLLDSMVAIIVSQRDLEVSAIREQVRAKLPTHSHPDKYVIAEHSKVPLKENGKVDRPKLIELYAN